MMDIHHITSETAKQLTPEDIAYLMAYPNENGSGTCVHKIPLIKFYRAKTGKGLRDAKTAVEAAMTELGDNVANMQAIFGFDEDVGDQPVEVRLKVALAFAVDNWKVMGFGSPMLAARAILSNFQAQSDPA